MSRQSRDPVKRARCLANLKPFKKGEAHFGRAGGRGGKPVDLDKVPGMRQFVDALSGASTRSMHQALVRLARENTPAAFAFIVHVATHKGFSTRNRIYACELIVDRGFGRAPMLVKVDDDRPGLAQPTTGLDGKTYAAEVYRILREAGAVLPDEIADIRRDDAAETVVEPEAVRSETTAVAVVEPVVVVEPVIEPPTHTVTLARRGARRAENQRTSLGWLLDAYRAGNVGGVDLDAAAYPTIRAALLASSDLDARAVVEALDRRFG